MRWDQRTRLSPTVKSAGKTNDGHSETDERSETLQRQPGTGLLGLR